MASRVSGAIPMGCAAGPSARRAFAAWASRRNRLPASSSEHLRIGSGVWYRGSAIDGGTDFVRMQILAHDPLAGRWLVASVDNPKLQFYAGRDRLLPRYVGELAPGIPAEGHATCK